MKCPRNIYNQIVESFFWMLTKLKTDKNEENTVLNRWNVSHYIRQAEHIDWTERLYEVGLNDDHIDTVYKKAFDYYKNS